MSILDVIADSSLIVDCRESIGSRQSATGWMQLFQVVVAPRESPPPSWTRADVYQLRRLAIDERAIPVPRRRAG
jgi:hypothetical protein